MIRHTDVRKAVDYVYGRIGSVNSTDSVTSRMRDVLEMFNIAESSDGSFVCSSELGGDSAQLLWMAKLVARENDPDVVIGIISKFISGELDITGAVGVLRGLLDDGDE